jgi:Cu(I)/Ag(I) efflux system protein CusF
MQIAKVAGLILSTTIGLGPAAAASPEGSGRILLAQATAKAAGEGVIKGIDAKERKLLVTHGPIPALKWQGMTMPFGVTSDADLSSLEPGTKIKFNVTRDPNGLYILEDIRRAD